MKTIRAIIILLSVPGSLVAQAVSPAWTVTVGAAATEGGDYNARGAFVGEIVYDRLGSRAIGGYLALGYAPNGQSLAGDCVRLAALVASDLSGCSFRHFPGWTALTGGVSTRWQYAHVAAGVRAGLGVIGYQERVTPDAGGNVEAGGYTIAGELGAEIAMARRPGRLAPVVSARTLVFRGPHNVTLRAFPVGLGVRF